MCIFIKPINGNDGSRTKQLCFQDDKYIRISLKKKYFLLVVKLRKPSRPSKGWKLSLFSYLYFVMYKEGKVVTGTF